jgi:hypothetical protein
VVCGGELIAVEVGAKSLWWEKEDIYIGSIGESEFALHWHSSTAYLPGER